MDAQAKEAQAKWRADQEARLNRPATTGDIERLIKTVNQGWIGRGMAIGLGMFLFGLVPVLIVVWVMTNLP